MNGREVVEASRVLAQFVERISRRTARNAPNPEGSVGRLWAIPFLGGLALGDGGEKVSEWSLAKRGNVVPLEVLAGPHRLVPTFLSDPWDQGNGLWRNAKPGVVRSPLEIAQAS